MVVFKRDIDLSSILFCETEYIIRECPLYTITMIHYA